LSESLPAEPNAPSRKELVDPTNGNGASLEISNDTRQILNRLHLKPEATQALIQIVTSVAKAESFSGPMPHPRHLNEYEKTLPGSAERILSMAEKEQNHRHRQEDRIVGSQVRNSMFGLCFALILSIGMLIGATYCAIINQPWVSGLFLSVAAVGMIKSFVEFGKKEETPKAETTKNSTAIANQTKKKSRNQSAR
jgi:uncharacterized membrane protein